MPRGERRELEEERVDQDRRHEDEEDEDRQVREPEPEPPALGAAAQEEVEEPHDRDPDDESDGEPLDAVPEPGAPALYGLLVLERELLSVDLCRELEDPLGHEEQGDEDGRLPEPALRDGLRAVAKARTELPGDDHDEHGGAPEKRDEVQAVSRPSVRDRLLPFLGRQGVGRRRRRRGRDAGGRSRRGRLLRQERRGQAESGQESDNSHFHGGKPSRVATRPRS